MPRGRRALLLVLLLVGLGGGVLVQGMGMRPVGGPSGSIFDIFKKKPQSKAGDAGANIVDADKTKQALLSKTPTAPVEVATPDVGNADGARVSMVEETSLDAAATLNDRLRIISLGPNITEVLFDIGAEDLLVGVTAESDYPPAAKKLPRVGRFGQPNLETIVSLKPTHILAPFAAAPVLATYQRLGLPISSYPDRKLSDILAMYSKLGELTGRKANAERRMKTLQAKLKLLEKNMPEKKPRVYFELWGNPPMSVGYTSYLNELIQAAGGFNITQTIPQAYPYVSQELVIAQNPEVIILAYQTDENLALRPGWAGVDAVVNKRVFALPHPDLLLRPGPRVADGIRELRSLLFPTSAGH